MVVIRPPNSEEQNGNLIGAQIQLDGSWVIDLKDSAPSVPTATPSKEPRYQFAAAYGFQAHPLETLCSQEVEPLIQGFLNGESAAIVAYGETGSGKSYICGTQALKSQPWEHSIGPYVARRVWEWAAEKKVQAPTIECSMIEVCAHKCPGQMCTIQQQCVRDKNEDLRKNHCPPCTYSMKPKSSIFLVQIYREGSGKEQIYDLLVGFERRKVKGEYHGWSEHQIASPQELLGKLTDGAQLRNTSLTDGNARSSRSHAIFTIRLRYTRKGADGKQQRVTGRLMLVDLAGAEAASSAQVGSTQQKQGSGINTGLSALQKVISEASKGGQVPYYRLSKLTHLLKPALGGEGGRNGCNLLFLGCIVPVAGAATRTRNTLE